MPRPRPGVPLSARRTYSFSQRISIFLSEEEPDQDNLSFLTVPYSRHLLSDETDLPLTITDLVSFDAAVVAGCGATKARSHETSAL